MMATASKCQICRANEREWMYQPWGPGNEANFTFPGSHYRGYEAIGICDPCKRRIEAGEVVDFRHKGRRYTVNGRRLMDESSFLLVREKGTLEKGGTHILLGDDPDWDVMLCGHTIRDHEQEVLGGRDTTVGDVCRDCIRAFADLHDFDMSDVKKHRAYPA